MVESNTLPKQLSIDFVAEIENVKEISLLCKADRDYWTRYLADDHLTPVDFEGKAKLLLTCTEAKFKSIAFREFIITLFIEPTEPNSQQDTVFLLHGYTSNRWFAWSERLFFNTPYHYAEVSFDSTHFSHSAAFENKMPQFILRNTLHLPDHRRKPVYTGPEEWNGHVFLPTPPNSTPKHAQYFQANINGVCEKYDFDPTHDSILVNHQSPHGLIRTLQQSKLTGCQWVIRQNATHRKSKTKRFARNAI